MANVFKLPNGGCMYSHEEIKVACSVYNAIIYDYENSCDAATHYANIMWKQIPTYKRAWYRLKSGIFRPDEWYQLYSECFKKGMNRWHGSGITKYTILTSHKFAADDLIRMESSCRNCYLSPDQIEVIEELSRLSCRI